uniref:Betacellulin n=1 Tax=Ovis aries TaxID=9940 RepID=A0AC11E4Q9_SHEEP
VSGRTGHWRPGRRVSGGVARRANLPRWRLDSESALRLAGAGRRTCRILGSWRIQQLDTWGCTCCSGPGPRGRPEGGKDPAGRGQAEGRGAYARERGVVAGKSTKVGAWETRPRRHPGEEEEKELLGWRCRPWGVWSLVESYLPVCAPWAGTRGLVILHCVLADGNSTRSPENDGLLCGDHAENCPVSTTQPKRRGHFSRCPKQYKHYCIKGRCRFVVAEQTPSCVCDEGYAGARCERVDLFYLRGDRGQILVICLIAVMVIFIILVVSICTCCHPLRKRRKRRKKEEEMETLGKDITPINDDIQETSIA